MGGFNQFPFGQGPFGNPAPATTGPAGTNVPRTSMFATVPANVTWHDGTLFDGFIWLGIVLPTVPAYEFPWMIATLRFQRIPQFIKIPIYNGAIDQTTQVFYSADINPPGTLYVAYWFSSDGTLITPASGTATTFEVNSPVTVATVPDLINPAGQAIPVPQP